MERLLILLALFLPALSFGATPAGVPMLTIAAAGSQTQALSIPLSALSGSGVNGVFSIFIGGNLTAADYYPFYKNGVAFQAASGDSVGAICFNMTAANSSGSTGYELMSATASFSDGANSVTGGKYQCGSGNTSCNAIPGTANTQFSEPGIYTFGPGTYAGIRSNSSTYFNIHMECIEI